VVNGGAVYALPANQFANDKAAGAVFATRWRPAPLTDKIDFVVAGYENL